MLTRHRRGQVTGRAREQLHESRGGLSPSTQRFEGQPAPETGFVVGWQRGKSGIEVGQGRCRLAKTEQGETVVAAGFGRKQAVKQGLGLGQLAESQSHGS